MITDEREIVGEPTVGYRYVGLDGKLCGGNDESSQRGSALSGNKVSVSDLLTQPQHLSGGSAGSHSRSWTLLHLDGHIETRCGALAASLSLRSRLLYLPFRCFQQYYLYGFGESLVWRCYLAALPIDVWSRLEKWRAEAIFSFKQLQAANHAMGTLTVWLGVSSALSSKTK